MPDLITRCPKCATAFRISDTLLKSAKGMVRCGSCLHVFNAGEYLQPQPSRPAPPPPPKTDDRRHSGSQQAPFVERRATAPATPISITGFLKQQDGTNEVDAQPSPEKNPRATNHHGGLFERSTPSHPLIEEEDDELDPEDDEAWALELLKDDSDLNVQFKKITETPKAPIETPTNASYLGQEHSQDSIDIQAESVSAPDQPAAPLAEGDASPHPVTKQEISVAHNEGEHDYPDDFLNDAPIAPADPEKDIARLDTHMREVPALPVAPDEASAFTPPPEPEEAKPEAAKSTTKPKRAETTNKRRAQVRPMQPAVRAYSAEARNHSMQEAIAAIEPEPLEVDWAPSPNWKKRLLWPALVLVASLLLVAQVAWLEFHRLSRVEPYRSFYAIACRHLKCTLPALIDRSKIQTSNLIVRSHPDTEGALMVDVVLRNTARFEQSFPSLLLTFSNLRNEPVASRRLTPSEYLGGELAGTDMMPIEQPIHIGLEIADPGSEAVSYNIAIVD